MHRGQINFAAQGAHQGIRGTVDNAFDPRLDKSRGAHGAGFQRDIDFYLIEAPVAQLFGCFLQANQLGVSGGVLFCFFLIIPAGDHFAVQHGHGAEGDFAFGRGFPGLDQGGEHGFLVEGN